MAELSVDEAQRLARLFLTGQAGDAEIARLQGALADDQGAALELLAQMQAALDDSAPAGLSAEQDRSVNSRIEALIAPRVKKRGPFSFISKLFKRKPKAEEAPKATRTRRRGAAPAAEPEATSAPAPTAIPEPMVSDDLGETLPGAGMEEMAPIAAAPAATAAPEKAAPSGAKEKPAKKPMPAWLMPAAGALLLILLLGGLGAWWMKRPKPLKPAPVVAALPKPTPSPTPVGRARRGVDIAQTKDEPLPAAIQAMTPIAAGSSNINE